ncbi:MAG TPA: CcmD family protein [Bacteroidota bacterium]|nr:CcmD family protein [Bacteroidota bacterium]
MYDFLQNNSLYLVLGISLLGWAGIFSYLVRLGARIRHLEKQDKQ